jgi:hypothetical protein
MRWFGCTRIAQFRHLFRCEKHGVVFDQLMWSGMAAQALPTSEIGCRYAQSHLLEPTWGPATVLSCDLNANMLGCRHQFQARCERSCDIQTLSARVGHRRSINGDVIAAYENNFPFHPNRQGYGDIILTIAKWTLEVLHQERSVASCCYLKNTRTVVVKLHAKERVGEVRIAPKVTFGKYSIIPTYDIC